MSAKQTSSSAQHSTANLKVPGNDTDSPARKSGSPKVIGFGTPVKNSPFTKRTQAIPYAHSSVGSGSPLHSQPTPKSRAHTTSTSTAPRSTTVKGEPEVISLADEATHTNNHAQHTQSHPPQPRKEEPAARVDLTSLFSDSDSDGGKSRKTAHNIKNKNTYNSTAKPRSSMLGAIGKRSIEIPSKPTSKAKSRTTSNKHKVMSSSDSEQDVDDIFSALKGMSRVSPEPVRRSKNSTRASAVTKKKRKAPTKKKAGKRKKSRKGDEADSDQDFGGYNTDDMIDDGSSEGEESDDSETARMYSSITNKIRQEQQDRIEADKEYKLRLLAKKLVQYTTPRELREQIRESYAMTKIELPKPQVEAASVFTNYRGSLARVEQFELTEHMPEVTLWDCLDAMFKKPEAKTFVRKCSKCDFRKLLSVWKLSGSGDAGIRLAESTTDKHNWIIITAAEVIERVVSSSRQMGSAMRQKYPPLAVDTQRNRQLVEAICCAEIETGRLKDNERLHSKITRGWRKTSGWLRSDTDSKKMYRMRSEYGYKHMSDANIQHMGNVIDYVSQDWKHFPGHTVTMPDGSVHATSSFCARGIRLAQQLANLIRAWAVFPMHLLLRKNLLKKEECQKLTVLVTMAVEYWTMKMTRYEETKLKHTHKNTVQLQTEGKSFMTAEELGEVLGRNLVPSDQEMDGSDYSD